MHKSLCTFFFLLQVITFIVPLSTSLLINPGLNTEQNSSRSQANKFKAPENSLSNLFDDDLLLNDAQESANFFTPDIGGPFDSPSDYGSLFDSFPTLPYFPDFGEIFRISRTTTPEPPFSFPEYVRDVFPERPPEPSAGDASSTSYRDTIGGGRRPARRPPRPASSGTRTKVSKQNQEPQEKPKIIKSKTPNKSRDYPKIFRFTSDRVNLAEFDTKKKMNENYLTLAKGDELDSDKVKRNKFLILHGGVFEIERSGRVGLFPASSKRQEDVLNNEDTDTF